eukprot:m.99463 g.99463  ORF g.99463 m.99463 type:complete len:91 (-) comp15099_c0_seq15:17-289(-)
MPVSKEAVWAVSNLASNGSEEQVQHIMGLEVICALAEAAASFQKDAGTLGVLLECLTCILRLESCRDVAKQQMEETGLLDQVWLRWRGSA